MRSLLVVAVAALLAAPAAFAADRELAGYCSESGDVCTSVQTRNGSLMLEITTAANYFLRYRVCVRGPEARTCKTFRMREAERGTYSSRVRWSGNFEHQGPGVYKVTWQYSAKTLTFKLPL